MSMEEEGFDLPVNIKGQEIQFPARLLQFSYSYKIEVDLYDTLVLFEPDESRNWRAVKDPAGPEGNKKITNELLGAVVKSIEEITK